MKNIKIYKNITFQIGIGLIFVFNCSALNQRNQIKRTFALTAVSAGPVSLGLNWNVFLATLDSFHWTAVYNDEQKGLNIWNGSELLLFVGDKNYPQKPQQIRRIIIYSPEFRTYESIGVGTSVMEIAEKFPAEELYTSQLSPGIEYFAPQAYQRCNMTEQSVFLLWVKSPVQIGADFRSARHACGESFSTKSFARYGYTSQIEIFDPRN